MISCIHVVHFVNEKDFYVKIVTCNLIFINIIKPKTYLSSSPFKQKPNRHNSGMSIFLAIFGTKFVITKNWNWKIDPNHMDFSLNKQSCGHHLTNNKTTQKCKVCYQTSVTRVVSFGRKMVLPPNKSRSQSFYTFKFYCYLSKMSVYEIARCA